MGGPASEHGQQGTRQGTGMTARKLLGETGLEGGSDADLPAERLSKG